jgi:hypothetical protein
MPKKKLNLGISLEKEIFEFIIRNGIKIYPVNEIEMEYLRLGKKIPFIFPKPIKYYIEFEQNGKKSHFKKKILNSEINDSIVKTYIHFYNQIKNKSDGIDKRNSN